MSEEKSSELRPNPSGSTKRLTRRGVFGKIKQGIVAIAEAHDYPLPPVLNMVNAEGFTPYEDFPFSIIGTGFVVDELGVILTAQHVVEKHLLALRKAKEAGEPIPPPPLVIFNEAYFADGNSVYNDFFIAPVRVVQSSDLLDIAAIGVTQPKNRHKVPFVPLSLAQEQCEEGDEIAVCGFPLGDNLISQHPGPYFSPSFSAGIVSASLSFPQAAPDTRTHFRMDIMVNPGNSGGPVFNQHTGEVVGIVSDTIEDFAAVQKSELQTSTTEGEEQPASDYIYLPTGLSHGVHALPWAESLIEEVKEKLLRM